MDSNIRPNITKHAGDPPNIILPTFTAQIWEEDHDMVQLRDHFTPDMRCLWDCGFDAFVSGDWKLASEKFQDVLHMSSGKDGPSKHLLNIIKDNSFEPPKYWKGYIDLR